MKVVAFNGSPHREGNTWQALKMVTAEPEAAGIETEIVTVNQCAGSDQGKLLPIKGK